MSRRKRLIRERFRDAVFSRDEHCCAVCGVSQDDVDQLDAHHITDRNELPYGGYVADNGIALCPECHEKAEVWHSTDHFECVPGYHPDDLYGIIGSTREQAEQSSERELARYH